MVEVDSRRDEREPCDGTVLVGRGLGLAPDDDVQRGDPMISVDTNSRVAPEVGARAARFERFAWRLRQRLRHSRTPSCARFCGHLHITSVTRQDFPLAPQSFVNA